MYIRKIIKSKNMFKSMFLNFTWTLKSTIFGHWIIGLTAAEPYVNILINLIYIVIL